VNFAKQDYIEILNKMLNSGGEYAEIFFEEFSSNSLKYDNGKFEETSYRSRKGASIRVVNNEETFFAHTNTPEKESLEKLAENLSLTVKKRYPNLSPVKIKSLENIEKTDYMPYNKDFETINVEEKIEVINKAVNYLKNYDERIKSFTVVYGDSTRKVRIVNSGGVIADDVRNYPLFYVFAIAANEKGELFSGIEGNSENKGFEFFTDEMIKETVENAARQAIAQLEGEDSPAGEFTIVLSSEAGGTMIHEACGHGMEADLVLSGSVYREKVGQQIASPKITVIDDGTIANKRGSLNFDDEGTKTEKTVLIENGILKNYMHSKLTAKKFNVVPTGNGRRETYTKLPVVRMRNTLIVEGNDSPEEILKSVEKGIFVRKMGGGQVDVISGDFQFKVSEGYMIENGKITTPLRGASLVGNGLEVLKSIDMVGNDLGYAVGTCGKDGQGAPVSDAQPTVRIPKMIVGGVVKGGKK